MITFTVTGRCIASPPAEDWREHLTFLLGAKPRRIGTWAELGLFGALSCMADAGETTLPEDALLILASLSGTYAATDIALTQIQDDLPMPMTFLQTQPSQVLALLSARLNWKGNASFYAGAELQNLLLLAAAQASAGGVLLGFIEEYQGASSIWLRLRPGTTAASKFVAVPADEINFNQISCLKIEAGTFSASYTKPNSME